MSDHPQNAVGVDVQFQMILVDSPAQDGKKWLEFIIRTPLATYGVALEPVGFRDLLPGFFREASRACDEAIKVNASGGIVVASADTLDTLRGNTHGQ